MPRFFIDAMLTHNGLATSTSVNPVQGAAAAGGDARTTTSATAPSDACGMAASPSYGAARFVAGAEQSYAGWRCLEGRLVARTRGTESRCGEIGYDGGRVRLMDATGGNA